MPSPAAYSLPLSLSLFRALFLSLFLSLLCLYRRVACPPPSKAGDERTSEERDNPLFVVGATFLDRNIGIVYKYIYICSS